MKKILILVAVFTLAITLSGCAKGSESLKSVGLDGLNGKEILTGQQALGPGIKMPTLITLSLEDMAYST